MSTLILLFIILACISFAFSRSFFVKKEDCGCGHGNSCVKKENSNKK